MQNDITLKASARQAILDEIDKDKPQSAVAEASTGQAVGAQNGDMPKGGEESDDDLFGDDDEDYEDAEGETDPSASASRSRTPGSTTMPPPDLPGHIERTPSKLSVQAVGTPASEVDADSDAEGEETENEGDEQSEFGTDVGDDDADAQTDADAEGDEEEEGEEDADADADGEEEDAEGEERADADLQAMLDREMSGMLDADGPAVPEPAMPSNSQGDVIMSDPAQPLWKVERKRAEGYESGSGSSSSEESD